MMKVQYKKRDFYNFFNMAEPDSFDIEVSNVL